MAKRFFDFVAAIFALALFSPIMLAAAIGIKLADPGPVLYRARRMGLNERPFVMYKFRTMLVNQGQQPAAITGIKDARVFAFGAILRKSKIDELPQLFNVIKGEMSVVGPRPEDVDIVNNYYTKEYKETLLVRPGLSSPGSIFCYTHGDRFLHGDHPEEAYRESLLPIKIALEKAYMNNTGFLYDLMIILRTLHVVVLAVMGKMDFDLPPELAEARKVGYLDGSKIESLFPT